MELPLFNGRDRIRVHALLVGDRIDLRALEQTHRLATAPLTIRAGDHGCAVLFRYGAVVLFGLDPLEEVTFLNHLAPLVVNPSSAPETEDTEIHIVDGAREGVDSATGAVVFNRISVIHLQLLADVLAKSAVLAQSESVVANVFDRIEPLAADLQQSGKSFRRSRQLLRYIGQTLLIQHRTVGRVEIVEKPELLWEHPELERLHVRLNEEYELFERQTALENKLDLISRTASTLLELLQNRRTLHVEWYIVILIVVEVLLTLYEMFIRH